MRDTTLRTSRISVQMILDVTGRAGESNCGGGGGRKLCVKVVSTAHSFFGVGGVITQ